jgi:hypothetical protein
MAWSLVEGKASTTVSTTSPAKPKIMICLPQEGTASFEFFERTWFALKVEPMPWCERGFLMCRVPSLPLARNILIREFLKTDCTHILWIDSDMLLQDMTWSEALQRMVKSLEETGESIVSGLYRAKQAHGFNYAAWKTAPPEMNQKGYVHVQGWGGNWFEADVVGLGCCLMKRRVLEDLMKQRDYAESTVKNLKEKYKSEISGVEHLITFEEPVHWETPDTESEDFSMLQKARKLGYKAWVLTDIKLSHEAKVVINTSGSFRVPSA